MVRAKKEINSKKVKQKETPKRQFICQHCGKIFSRNKLVQNHELSHTGIKPLSCSVESCSFRTISTSNLKRHIDRLHSNQDKLQFTCPLCGQNLTTKSGLEDHRRYIHSLERPYACDECPQSFKVKNALNRHMVTHTNTRAHACSQCNQTYVRAAHLRRHIQSVHTEKPSDEPVFVNIVWEVNLDQNIAPL